MRFASRWITLALLSLSLAQSAAIAGKARFLGAPQIGDRNIGWRWEALAPGVDSLGVDPYYEGNTVIELASSHPIHENISVLRTSTNADHYYGVSADDNRIRVYSAATGDTLKTLGAPPSRILDMDVREVKFDRNQVLILAGLEDGKIALWDLRLGRDPQVSFAQRSACRFARFLVVSTSMDELRFVTSGDEDTARVWQGPGTLRFKFPLNGLPNKSLAIAQNGRFLALGDATGLIRIYEPLRSETLLQALSVYQAEVAHLLFSRDTKTLVSADVTGKMIIWSTNDWSERAEIQLNGAPGAPEIGVRDPDASLVYSVDSSGLFRVFDGRDGRPFNQLMVVDTGAGIGTVAFGNSGRTLVVFPNNDRRFLTYLTGFCAPSATDPSCFGGYKIWRSPTPRPEDAVLLRIFGFGDSTWTFVSNERAFVDPDSIRQRGAQPVDENHSLEPVAGPHNGIPYYYSVTSFANRYLDGSTFPVGDDPGSIYAGFYRADPNGPPSAVMAHSAAYAARPYLEDVIVVPNPFEAGKVSWEGPLGQHIEFRNLPSQATIQIYTVGGDLLRTLEHGLGTFGESTDVQMWDLKNEAGRMVTSGVYLYHITTKLNKETNDGFFTVVR